MRVGFAGTPAFAATALAAILDARFDVTLVLTRPDRPRGRGLKLEPSAVKALALHRGVPVLQPATLRTAEAQAGVLERPLDVLIVAAYGLILPREVLGWPRFGCLNIHASLLPRWRGPAPIQRAIEAGDTQTGITIMQMDEGLDTGAIVDTLPVPIAVDDTSGSLELRLAAVGSAAIVGTLARLREDGRLSARPQPPQGATYATKIGRADAAIDWRADAASIDRKVRALDPAPGAFTVIAREATKVWRVEASSTPAAGAAPGTVLAAGRDGIVVACGNGLVRVVELQPPGRRRMSAGDFLAGHRLPAGARFDVVPSATDAASGAANR